MLEVKPLNAEVTQRVNKTDWFFLAGSLSRDANTRRHLKWELKKKTECKAGNTAKV